MPSHTFRALNNTFAISAEYTFIKELGQGSSGLVVSARNNQTGESCAIKKISNINSKVRARCIGYESKAHSRRGGSENVDKAMPT